MKFIQKKTGKVFITTNKNLFSMLEREGYEPKEEKSKE